MKNLNILIILYFFTTGCGNLSEAGKVLRNEKTKTTDEFLVKKRDPLVLPPDYKNIPEPGLKKSEEKSNKKIKEILKVPEEEKINKKSSSVEDAILKEIGR